MFFNTDFQNVFTRVNFTKIAAVAFGINTFFRIIKYRQDLSEKLTNNLSAQYNYTDQPSTITVTNNFIQVSQNNNECGLFFAVKRFIILHNKIPGVINKKLALCNLILNSSLFLISGYNLFLDNLQQVMFIGNAISIILDITYLFDKEFKLDLITVNRYDTEKEVRLDVVNYLNFKKTDAKFQIGDNNVIEQLILKIYFNKNTRYQPLRYLVGDNLI